jgi:type IV secretion system protein VirB5
MEKCLYLSSILGIISCIQIPAYAVMPVIDAAAIVKLAQEIEQLEKQYDLLQSTYRNAQQQLDKAKQMVKDSEGHYGYGDLINSSQDLKNREWSPDNWDNALKGLSGGNPDRYRQLINDYQKNHPSLSQSDFQKGASLARANDYTQRIEVNRASQTQASYAFNDIKQHIENVHILSNEIEKSPNTKSAIDLNSRILTEIAYISIQELKMQSLINQQLAQQSASDIQAETEESKFVRLPDE